jgi:hypothetical protein
MSGKKILLSVCLVTAAIFLSTCAIPGKVFIMIAWDAGLGTPSTIVFTPAISKFPSTVPAIEVGHYYAAGAGTYSVTATYPVAPFGPFTLANFSLVLPNTILGSENNYYDLFINRNNLPVLTKVPPK